ncbi:hypothetical protein N7526_009045 [Penicillium atrosanguineum]|nr:hypothetical protein N7526_009045 [Penicillium atrosanguineum]
MTSAAESLELANIVFYAMAVLPAIYCFIQHGKHGIVGWLYVILMCGLRLAGNGISYHAISTTGKPNTAASIIVGIGLSPLLFSALGILHESNTSIQSVLSPFLGWAGMLIPHLVIGAGIGLAAASGNNLNLLKVGMIILAMGWLMITGMIVLSFKAKAHRGRLPGERKLLLALAIAILFIGVIFGTLPEFLVMSIYLSAGIVTRNLPRDRMEKSRVTDNTAYTSVSDPSYGTTYYSVAPPPQVTGHTNV